MLSARGVVRVFAGGVLVASLALVGTTLGSAGSAAPTKASQVLTSYRYHHHRRHHHHHCGCTTTTSTTTTTTTSSTTTTTTTLPYCYPPGSWNCPYRHHHHHCGCKVYGLGVTSRNGLSPRDAPFRDTRTTT